MVTFNVNTPLQSLTMWFNYKAQRTLKKMQIEATLRVSGRDIFRRERWLSSIRPALVRILGHEDSTKPEWVGTYKRVVATLWNLLSEDEKAQYDKMAEEENKGHASRENKIAFVLNPFSIHVTNVTVAVSTVMPTSTSRRG